MTRICLWRASAAACVALRVEIMKPSEHSAILISDPALARRARRHVLAVHAVLALVATATFAQTLSYPFVYDDRYIIEQNPLMTQAGGWADVLTARYWPPGRAIDSLYRPFTLLTLKLNHALGHGHPFGFRIVNMWLHAVATLAVARLAGCLWRRATAAWVAGLLFAVHPLHADALGLVVGRSELLVAVFVTWMLIRHVGRWETDQGAAPCVKYHVSTALLFLLALASKEHAIIVWPALLLIDGWYTRSRASKGPMPRRAPRSAGIVPEVQNATERPEPFLRRMLASHHLGLMFALAAYLFMRWVVYGPLTTLPADMVNPFANPLLGQPLTVQAASAFALLGLAVRQWFLAAPLCPIWSVGGWELPDTFLRADVLLGLAVAGAAVLTIGLGWRRRWRLGMPIAVLLLALLLPCHFVPAANWLYAERWMYLPSVFLAVLCGGLAVWAPRVSVAGALVAAALFLAVCVPYQRCWASHAAVFEGTVQRQPYSYHGLLGVASVHRQAGRVSDAAPEIGRLVDRFPQSDRTWFYQALIADERADWDAAAEALRQWGALANPETAPEELQRVAEHLRAHGR